nr:G2/mitotic-specific cyclin S13-7-like isoform X2 [Ipomoea batatas]
MASRAILRDQPPRGEGVKQKNVAGDGRNRKVLRDIGNLRNAPHDQIGRPITRGFCAQDKIKASSFLIKKNSVQVVSLKFGSYSGRVWLLLEVRDNGSFVYDLQKPVVAAQKKEAAVKPSPARSVIVISSDEEEDEEVEILSGKNKKKTGKTFSSTLTARSKAACGITKKQQNEQILEIDAADSGNELAVLDYVEDIYKFYKLSEDEGRVGDYMAAQPEINAKMRAILVDWLVEVHRKFELMPETFYLTVNLIDRFLSMKTVPRKELQLVGISAMLIACKYEEIWAPEVNDFIMISDNAYVRAQVLAMEKTILGKLEWYLTVPTPYVFLVRKGGVGGIAGRFAPGRYGHKHNPGHPNRGHGGGYGSGPYPPQGRGHQYGPSGMSGASEGTGYGALGAAHGSTITGNHNQQQHDWQQ